MNDLDRVGTLELKRIDSVATLNSNEREFLRSSNFDFDPHPFSQNNNWVRQLVVQHPRKGRTGVSRLSSVKSLAIA
jgi:hypothetical protein